MPRPINSFYSQLRRWRRYRETVRELSNLSSRELSDVGIVRGDINRVARDASRI